MFSGVDTEQDNLQNALSSQEIFKGPKPPKIAKLEGLNSGTLSSDQFASASFASLEEFIKNSEADKAENENEANLETSGNSDDDDDKGEAEGKSINDEEDATGGQGTGDGDDRNDTDKLTDAVVNGATQVPDQLSLVDESEAKAQLVTKVIDRLESHVNNEPSTGVENVSKYLKDNDGLGDLYWILQTYLSSSEHLEQLLDFLKSHIGSLFDPAQMLELGDRANFFKLLGLALINIAEQTGQNLQEATANENNLVEIEITGNEMPSMTDNATDLKQLNTGHADNQDEMTQTPTNEPNVINSQKLEQPQASTSGNCENLKQLSEPKQYCIYKRLESVSQICFSRMALTSGDDKKKIREVGKILFDTSFDEKEILENYCKERAKPVDGVMVRCKKFCESKTCTIARFLAWIRSEPENKSIEDFKNFEALMKRGNKTGLEVNGLLAHFNERIMQKHACTRRKRLENVGLEINSSQEDEKS